MLREQGTIPSTLVAAERGECLVRLDGEERRGLKANAHGFTGDIGRVALTCGERGDERGPEQGTPSSHVRPHMQWSGEDGPWQESNA